MDVLKCFGLVVLSLSEMSSSQKEGDLQLRSGSSSGGRLEMYFRGVWLSICSNGFDFYEGDIACRQLHFLYANVVGTAQSLNYTSGNRNGFLTEVNCSSSDTKLINCSTIYSTSCHNFQEIAIQCTNRSNPLRLVSDTGRTRLLSSGRLEVYLNRKWGTVCSTNFSKWEADVACRQIGYERANGFISTARVGYEDSSSKPVLLDQFNCNILSSNTNNLRLCSQMSTRIGECEHSNDVFLSCVSPGLIRLRSSFTSSLTTNGQLEMYWNGQWSAICSYPFFTSTNAQVACRQLGFETVVTYTNGHPSNIMYVLSGIKCSSTDLETLLNCSHDQIEFPNSRCGSSPSSVLLSCAAKRSSMQKTTPYYSVTTRRNSLFTDVSRSPSNNISGISAGIIAIVVVVGLFCMAAFAIYKYRYTCQDINIKIF